jgi:hypothetical protein
MAISTATRSLGNIPAQMAKRADRPVDSVPLIGDAHEQVGRNSGSMRWVSRERLCLSLMRRAVLMRGNVAIRRGLRFRANVVSRQPIPTNQPHRLHSDGRSWAVFASFQYSAAFA